MIILISASNSRAFHTNAVANDKISKDDGTKSKRCLKMISMLQHGRNRLAARLQILLHIQSGRHPWSLRRVEQDFLHRMQGSNE